MRASISVCMATFNGEPFVRDQLESIVDQLEGDDEVVIVDDCSTDDTLAVLSEFLHARIHIYRNQENRGHVATFERALMFARNDIILFADQDDIWKPGRVDLMVNALRASGKVVLSSNSEYVNASGTLVSFPGKPPLRAIDSANHLRNIVRVFAGTASYYGCAMAFSREIVTLIHPIPSYVESHDLWLALAGNLIRSNVHIDEATLFRRIHGSNTSLVRRRLSKKLSSRIVFAVSLIHLGFRYLLYRRHSGSALAPTP